MKRFTSYFIILLLLFSDTLSAQTRPSFLQLKDVPATDVRVYGAKGDGITDDTDEIQAAIDANNAIIIPANHTFKITDNLTVTKDSFTVIGFGGEIKLAALSKKIFDVTGDNFRAEGLMLSGPTDRIATAPESTYGFHFEGVAGGIIRDCNISYLTYGVKIVTSRDVTVTNNIFSYNLPLLDGAAGYGVLTGSADRILVTQNHFNENRHAIYFSSSSTYNTASHNTCINSWSEGISIYTKDIQARGHHYLIDGNYISGKPLSELSATQHGITAVENVEGVTIINNVVTDVARAGVWLETSPTGVYEVHDVKVIGNTITGCGQYAIRQQRCSDVIIENNSLFDSDVGVSIEGYTTASPTQTVGRVTLRGNNLASITIPLSISGGVENVIGPILLGRNQFEILPANISASWIETGVIDLSDGYCAPLRFSLPGVASTPATTMLPDNQLWGSIAAGYLISAKYSEEITSGAATGTLYVNGLSLPPLISLGVGESSVVAARTGDAIPNVSMLDLANFTISTSVDFAPTTGTFTVLITPIQN